jgi:hypothetical protein
MTKFKDPGPKRKFGLMLITVYLVSLPVISTITQLLKT